MAKDTYYFSHDYNARNDSKIKRLLSKHGYLGYGLFWAIVEDLYNNANALPTQSDSNAIKESKGKETKLNKSIVFTPPILEDVLSYFKDNGYSEISAQKAFRYYNDANWMDSKGNKVKNWKQKMQGVWFKDENKQIEKSITPKMVY